MQYFLFDLDIETVGDPKKFNCSHRVGDGLLAKGENISFKPGTKQFSHFALSTLLPYIAAKQRAVQKTDWMFFETDIACPDPKCAAVFRIRKTKRRVYEYSPIK